MIEGKSIAELGSAIQDNSQNRLDIVVPQQAIRMTEPDAIEVETESDGSFEIVPNEVMHRGIAGKLQIPWGYYNRMQQDAPGLLTTSVNRWLDEKPEKMRLVRNYDNGTDPIKGRALLSNRYRCRDDIEVFTRAVPILHENGFKLVSSEVTDTRMHLQVRMPRLEGEVAKGDVVNMGLAFRNSEVGYGATEVEILIYRLICLNGMTNTTATPLFRELHMGSAIEAGRFSHQTQALESEAFGSAIADVVREAAKGDRFKSILTLMQGTAKNEIKEPTKVIRGLGKDIGLRENEIEAVFDNYLTGGSNTQWGLSNAVTALAHNSASYDRATEIEGLGGKVLRMSPRKFEAYALS